MQYLNLPNLFFDRMKINVFIMNKKEIQNPEEIHSVEYICSSIICP